MALEGSGYRGRPLLQVLQELKEGGLNLIFSSAVVGEDLLVTVEPTTTEPRAMLDQILPPLGLEARDGPAGSILIVRAPGFEVPGTIIGRVISAARGAPIDTAAIRIVGADARAATRPDGTFELQQVSPGTYEVAIEAPGFTTATVGSVRVPPGDSVTLAVTLNAEPRYVEEVVVTPSKHSLVREEQGSHLALGNQDAVMVPTIGGDVSRVIEMLPGVAAPDNSAAFNLRGSLARDASLVLDGLELYDPFHLESFQSPFSLIDSKIVDTIDFFGGGFTADMGDRHGGFVRMSTWVPQDPYRARIEVGTLNSRLSYGAPWSGGSWLVSARAWYPQLFWNTIELGEDGLEPTFGDLYVKAAFNVSPRTVISTHALVAHDRLTFEESDGDEQVESDNTSAYVWVRALQSWSPTLSSDTLVSAGRIDRSRVGVSEPEDEVVSVDDQRTVDFIGLKHDMGWEISETHLFKTGLEIRRLDAEYRYVTESEDIAVPSTTLRLDPDGTSFGVYAAYRTSLTSTFAGEIGLRWDRQTYTDDDQLSPRLNALWRPSDRTQLRLGLGRFHQSQRINELEIEDGETEFLPAELSQQADLTFQQDLGRGIRLRLDAYYWTISDVQPRYENLFNPVELFPETEADRVLIAPSGARLRGAELLVRGEPTGPISWWVSGTWSSAEDVIDGSGVPRSWDQTWSGKFLVAYRGLSGWSFSLAGSAHTGWPTTPVSAEQAPLPGGGTEIVRILGPRNSDRFSTYLRFDGKVSREFLLRSSRLRLDVEIINLTDRDNVCCVDDFLFDPQPDGSVSVDRELNFWLGIAPTVSLLWEF